MNPGGYVEFQGIDFHLRSDDHTHEGTYLDVFMKNLVSAAKKNGRPIDCAPHYARWMKDAGFEDVVQKTFRWPQNHWPRDSSYKEIGSYTFHVFDSWLEALSLDLFTRELRWTVDKVKEACRLARITLGDPWVHAYFTM